MKYINYLLKKKQKKEQITALTAYDHITARILEEAGIDIILVGDSYGMVKLGFDNTLPVTMEQMLTITKAVSTGVKDSIIIADMPFLSFHTNTSDAIKNAGLFLKETKAQGVKIESHKGNLDLIGRVIKADIPVMGHLGLVPQSIYRLGGYKTQGKTAEEALTLISMARQLEDLGCFAIILEGVASEVTQKIAEALRIPIIGIGSGPCDGQILVLDDLLGCNPDINLKHAKKYANLFQITKQAVVNYKKDIVSGKFPDKTHYDRMNKDELNKLQS
ncbi:MAG: 3-methyl-2-oxobutanoate hydroxymethyltransferase [Spirochaetes bacterium]|nr:3-methyl-2-oxobutanoate hydroxymethyltransferase [Spirochaetota bacterium]